MKNIFLVIILLLFTSSIFASNFKSAKIDTLPNENDPKFQALLQKAKNGDAVSMFHVGQCYLFGSYVKQDFEQGYNWTDKSANAGYGRAWVELSFYHKYGTGRSVDFKKSFEILSKGAEIKDTQSIYLRGYMKYKGFGCTQDYAAAILDFIQSAELGNVGAMYTLGICYRNGYGTQIDIEKARFWLKKAFNANSRIAFDELQSIKPELDLTNPILIENKGKANELGLKAAWKTDVYENFKSNVKTGSLTGNYEGYLLRYDWSKTQIIEATPITLNLNVTDTIIKGTWAEFGRTKKLEFDAVWKNNQMLFKKTLYSRKDHFHKARPLIYAFKSANIVQSEKGDMTYLRMNVAINIPSLREPYYPVTLVLKKAVMIVDSKVINNENSSLNIPEEVQMEQKDNLFSLNAFPNPFENEINVSYFLPEKSDITIKVTSIDGKMLYNNNFIAQPAGEQMLNIPLAVISGEYIISIATDKNTETIKILKP